MRTLLEDIVQEIEQPARDRRVLAYLSPRTYAELQRKLEAATHHLSPAHRAIFQADTWQDLLGQCDRQPGLAPSEREELAARVALEHIHRLRGNSAATLAQWLSEEQACTALLESGPGPGLLRARHVANRSGYTILRGMQQGDVPYPSCARSMGFCMVDLQPGSATLQGTPSDRFLDPMGDVHGGWLSSLLDAAMTTTLQSSLAAGVSCMAIELNTRFVKRLSPHVSRVRAVARIGRPAERRVHVDGRLFGPDGAVYAEADGSFLVLGDASGSRQEMSIDVPAAA